MKLILTMDQADSLLRVLTTAKETATVAEFEEVSNLRTNILNQFAAELAK
jgi:hypothetical protein